MELSKEEYIKLKQKEYYVNNYKKNNKNNILKIITSPYYL